MFTREQMQVLNSIKGQMQDVHRYITDKKKWKMTEYWESDEMLRATVNGSAKLNSDCEEYALASLRKANAAGFHARLVICRDETGEGHCICEVSSDNGQAAVYFDNRRKTLVPRSGLKGYRFYSVSPWNPEPGETRPWLLVKG